MSTARFEDKDKFDFSNEKDTISDEYQQYYSDFYLTKYGIHIEYFGIDKNNNVAPFFKSKNGKSGLSNY